MVLPPDPPPTVRRGAGTGGVWSSLERDRDRLSTRELEHLADAVRSSIRASTLAPASPSPPAGSASAAVELDVMERVKLAVPQLRSWPTASATISTLGPFFSPLSQSLSCSRPVTTTRCPFSTEPTRFRASCRNVVIGVPVRVAVDPLLLAAVVAALGRGEAEARDGQLLGGHDVARGGGDHSRHGEVVGHGCAPFSDRVDRMPESTFVPGTRPGIRSPHRADARQTAGAATSQWGGMPAPASRGRSGRDSARGSPASRSRPACSRGGRSWRHRASDRRRDTRCSFMRRTANPSSVWWIAPTAPAGPKATQRRSVSVSSLIVVLLFRCTPAPYACRDGGMFSRIRRVLPGPRQHVEQGVEAAVDVVRHPESAARPQGRRSRGSTSAARGWRRRSGRRGWRSRAAPTSRSRRRRRSTRSSSVLSGSSRRVGTAAWLAAYRPGRSCAKVADGVGRAPRTRVRSRAPHGRGDAAATELVDGDEGHRAPQLGRASRRACRGSAPRLRPAPRRRRASGRASRRAPRRRVRRRAR